MTPTLLRPVRALIPDHPRSTVGAGRLRLEHLALAVGAILVVGDAAWLIAGVQDPDLHEVATAIAAPAVDLLAAMLVGLAAVGAAPGRVRSAWTLLAVAMVVYTVGDASYAWIQTALGGDAFPSVADVAYVAFYPIVAAALLLFPPAERARRETARLAIDSGIVLLGGGMVVWHAILDPVLSAPETDPAARLLALGYPMGDLVLLLGVGTIALRRPAGIRIGALLALVAGLAIMLGADIAYGEIQLVQGGGVEWVDALYMASSWVIGLAGVLQRRGAAPMAEDRDRIGGLLLRLPYLALVAGFTMLVFEVTSVTDHRHVFDLVIGAIGLTALVLIRQELMSRENAGLVADAAQRAAEARYRALEREASDAFLLLDRDGTVAYASASLERVVNVDPSSILGRSVDRLAHADDAAALRALVDDVVAGRPVAPLEWRIWTRAGAWQPVESIPANLLENAAIGKVALTTRDVGERHALRQQIVQATLRDPLTGIPNRVLFEDRTAQVIAAGRRDGTPTGLILVDIDGFSRVNGSYGHAAGDRVLREVARRFAAVIRSADTVARMSGDSFAILVSGPAGTAETTEVARRALAALQEPMTDGATTFELTASIGVVTTDCSGDEDAASLLRDADVALAVAQQPGAGPIVVFEPSMQREVEGRFELEAELRQAITSNQLVLQYQPIVDLASHELVAAEALVRWQHPERGRIPPGVFIPVAEEAGLIGDIGTWVLREACRQAAAWAKVAPGRVPRVSVNLAAPQLADPQLPWIVQSTLAEMGAAPGWLTVEMTESLMVANTSDILERLHALRALGVKISIDDFGTGYSSLSYLERFPVNHVKIDRSFVSTLDQEGHPAGLVRAVIEIARALGMTTIAEGVETPRALGRLRELGCEFGQGFLFSRPVDADVMLEVAAHSDRPVPIAGSAPSRRRRRPR